MWNKFAVIIVIGLMVFGVLAGLGKTEDIYTPVTQPVASPKYTIHTPIYINGNSQFVPNGTNGVVSGSGTQIDPYIIEGWNINASAIDGICIRNTNVHFIIQSCYIHDGNWPQGGMYPIDGWNGTLFISVMNGVVQNNIFIDNLEAINLRSSSNISIKNNDCSLHSRYRWESIFLSYSSGNTIINNNCSCNSWYGIYLESSNNNTIFYNNITSNAGYGIFISSITSKYNRIHHNNFINNHVSGAQASDESSLNFWNSSYPSGGNYWSDLTTPDDKSGPKQDQSGSDGIVDYPYVFDGGNYPRDYYPLAEPVKDAGSKIPEPSPAPLVMIGIILIVAIVVRVKKKW